MLLQTQPFENENDNNALNDDKYDEVVWLYIVKNGDIPDVE